VVWEHGSAQAVDEGGSSARGHFGQLDKETWGFQAPNQGLKSRCVEKSGFFFAWFRGSRPSRRFFGCLRCILVPKRSFKGCFCQRVNFELCQVGERAH
jgi:hypothetical protein